MLYYNREGMARIFTYAKKLDPKNPDGKEGFNIVCARIFFMKFVENKLYKIEQHDIDRNFVYSMMTVQNEEANGKKYHLLLLVEWQELLCRLALEGYKGHNLENESIAIKVQYLLQGIWAYFYKHGIWKETDADV
jgi:hypothetical protein